MRLGDLRRTVVVAHRKRKQSSMGKIKPRLSSDSAKDATPKVSLKTIVKSKDKLKLTPVVQVKVPESSGVFPKRPTLPALKRKQKAKKQKRVPVDNADAASATPVHQKKHVKIAERKKKLAQKFELMLKDQQEAQKLKKVERANKKIGSVATMGAIRDALPSLDSLLKFKGSDLKTGIPEYDSIKVNAATKGKKSSKEKRGGKETTNKFAIKEQRISKQSKEVTKRYDYLQKLMNDKVFRKNPRQVISEHIKNSKLEQEAK